MIYPKSLGKKAHKTVGEYKPTEEELICLKYTKKTCKGDCERYRKEVKRLNK